MAEVGETASLACEVAVRLGAASCRLTPLGVSCANPVFRAEVSDGRYAFFKLGEPRAMRRSARRLAAMAGCALVPRVLIAPSDDFAGGRALCLEWRPCDRVEVVDMTDAQADSLVDGAVALSSAMQRVDDVAPPKGEDDPDRQYAQVVDFARRHPVVRGLLGALLTIPVEERSYAGRKLAVIHGDFHALNFGFAAGRLAVVFDFDTMAWGLPCEDLAYALCEDMRREGFGARRRARLGALFARFRARAPWSDDDWRLAVNHARLRIAARRISKHPGNPFVAFDIFKRDRALRPLVAACGEKLV